MDTTRTLKYGKLIQKELGEIFTLEGKNWYGNHFVTITGVSVTPDLSIARVRISVFKAPKPQEVLKSLKVHSSEIRKSLGNRTRHASFPTWSFFLMNHWITWRRWTTFSGILISLRLKKRKINSTISNHTRNNTEELYAVRSYKKSSWKCIQQNSFSKKTVLQFT
jgi:ribosome-binding factor A